MALERFDASSSSSDTENDASDTVSESSHSPCRKKPKVETTTTRNLSWNQLQSLEVDDPGSFAQLRFLGDAFK